MFLLSAITSLTLAATSVPPSAPPRDVTVRIVETSDVHGHFFPYDFIARRPLKGTLARVSTYVNRLRQDYGDRLLLIDNGDILQGQPTCYYSNFVMPGQPHIAARVINYMGYDAETVGNHDIEPGHAVYDKWIREVRCPVLGANIVDSATGQPYVRPYVVREVEGVRVAIVGMITPTIPYWLGQSVWQGLEFHDMVACARKWVDIIRREEQPHLIVGLFHSGKNGGITTPQCAENATETVAREVPGFDIIFYGHDHTRHEDWIENVDGQKVLCLDPSCYAQMVADATVHFTFDAGGQLLSKQVSGSVVSIADEEVDRRLVDRFQADIDSVRQFVDRRIGFFDKTIVARDCFFGSAPFTDYVHQVQLRLTGADISFNAPLAAGTRIDQGPVCVGDLFKLYPYENLICVLRLTGEEVRRHLELSYDRWVNTMTSPDDHILRIERGAWNSSGTQNEKWGFVNMTFNFDSAAGIDYEVDVSRPYGEKVRILRFTDGRPFDLSATYRVAMNSYRANGGGELLTLGAGIAHDELPSRIIFESERDQRYYLMLDIERQGHVLPRANGNWRFVPAEWAGPALRRDRQLLFNDLP